MGLKTTPQFNFALPVLLLLIAAVALSGCSTFAPVRAAKTVEQKAFALYGTFAIYQEAGVDIVRNETLPIGVRRAVQNADAAAKPIADSLLAATLEAQRVRAQVAAGTSTNARLVIVTNNLEDWVARAEPLINNLINAVTQ